MESSLGKKKFTPHQVPHHDLCGITASVRTCNWATFLCLFQETKEQFEGNLTQRSTINSYFCVCLRGPGLCWIHWIRLWVTFWTRVEPWNGSAAFSHPLLSFCGCPGKQKPSEPAPRLKTAQPAACSKHSVMLAETTAQKPNLTAPAAASRGSDQYFSAVRWSLRLITWILITETFPGSTCWQVVQKVLQD